MEQQYLGLRPYYRRKSFDDKRFLEIDVPRLMSWIARQNNPQQFLNYWRALFQEAIGAFGLNQDDHPSLVLVIDFSGVPHTSLSKKFQIFDAIKETKTRHPNINLEEVFIGNCYERFISRWRGAKWRNVASPEQAHEPLFKYLPAQLINGKFGGSYGMDNDDNLVAGGVDVRHGKMKSIRIPVVQETQLRITARVRGWNVTMKIEFIPLDRRTNFPILLFESKLVHDVSLNHNWLRRTFRAPVDGNVFVTVENSSFSTKKLIVDCLVQE